MKYNIYDWLKNWVKNSKHQNIRQAITLRYLFNGVRSTSFPNFRCCVFVFLFCLKLFLTFTNDGNHERGIVCDVNGTRDVTSIGGKRALSFDTWAHGVICLLTVKHENINKNLSQLTWKFVVQGANECVPTSSARKPRTREIFYCIKN